MELNITKKGDKNRKYTNRLGFSGQLERFDVERDLRVCNHFLKEA